jgi:hypothetical protein
MTEYALVGPNDEIKAYSRAVNPDVGTKPGWRWLPVERQSADFDPATEVREEETVAVDKHGVTITRPTRLKTEEELAAEEAEGLQELLPSPLAEILGDIDNRLRAIEGKDARTVDQFRSAAVARRR